MIECLLGHRSIVDDVRLRGENEAEEAMGFVIGRESYLRTPGMMLD